MKKQRLSRGFQFRLGVQLLVAISLLVALVVVKRLLLDARNVIGPLAGIVIASIGVLAFRRLVITLGPGDGAISHLRGWFGVTLGVASVLLVFGECASPSRIGFIVRSGDAVAVICALSAFIAAVVESAFMFVRLARGVHRRVVRILDQRGFWKNAGFHLPSAR